MPKGTLVTIGIGAANRDPEPFPDPDRFDVARNPTRHLAFGSGIHMCAGMSLARLEGPHRDRAVSQALSALRGRRRATAQPSRALPRLHRAASAVALTCAHA
jgi:cytochrome P450